ncbi:MAG: hypothetical protein WEB88_08460 [Gemmatimonadota bacterium]
MPRTIEADGDRWEVRAEMTDARPDAHALVFHCVSNRQRPYQVAEVPAADWDGRDVDGFEEEDLRRLFAGSQPLDYTHDADADDPDWPGLRADPGAERE